MTEQERLKTDTVFVDTVIRECALMTIQKEADAQRIAELEERLEAANAAPLAEPSAPLAEPSAALQRLLDKAVADLHFVMAGGDPCKVCSAKCTFGEKNCKPVWRGEAGGEL